MSSSSKRDNLDPAMRSKTTKCSPMYQLFFLFECAVACGGVCICCGFRLSVSVTEENHSNEHASHEIPPLTNIFESPIILSRGVGGLDFWGMPPPNWCPTHLVSQQKLTCGFWS